MDKLSFLASGLLESYVLGHCTPEEVRTVESMLAKYPDLHTERLAIETAMERVAQAHRETPPEGLKARIQERIAQEMRGGEEPTTQAPNTSRPWGWWLLSALLALGMLWTYRNAAQSRAERETLQQQLQACEGRPQVDSTCQQLVAFFNDPDTKRVTLRSPDANQPQPLVQVFVNGRQKLTCIGLTLLPDIRPDEDYQLWVIAKGNPNPIPLRVFASSKQLAPPMIEQPYHANAEAFAVSVEPKGGSPNGKPTKVVMLGKVTG